MDIFLSVLAFVCCIVGIAGSILPVLPGPALSFVGLLCAYGCDYSTLQPVTLWIWGAVTLVVVVADYFLPGYMAKLFGGSRAGTTGATVGMVVGLFFGLPGILLGPFVGAVAGELIHDRSDNRRALTVGFGSFLSFVVGTGLKLIATIGMLVYVMADTWPALRNWGASLFQAH